MFARDVSHVFFRYSPYAIHLMVVVRVSGCLVGYSVVRILVVYFVGCVFDVIRDVTSAPVIFCDISNKTI